mmetsp:Transcript_10304/g.10169  ORF Transcript_10304/g.10169 Transcript_10304/m.10169 type:complete len:131 (-) Transcript_10304:28-420(-)
MLYCQFDHEPISLLDSLTTISNQIKERSQFEEFEYLKEEVRQSMIKGETKIRLSPKSNKTSEELTEMLNHHRGIIEGSIIFDEFLKEYLTIFDAKNELIKIINIYEEQYEEDLILEEAILKLNKVRKESF